MPKFTEMSEKEMFDYFEHYDSCLTREVIVEKYSPLIYERVKQKLQNALITKMLEMSKEITGSIHRGEGTLGWQIKVEGKPFADLS